MPTPLKLIVYRGSEVAGEHFFDRDIIKIGRLASAHLKLEDPKVSRIHAVIEATSDGKEYAIIDMGSTEGTFLNGDRVSKERLKDGDEVRLGDTRLVVTFAVAGMQPSVATEPVAAAWDREADPTNLPRGAMSGVAQIPPGGPIGPVTPYPPAAQQQLMQQQLAQQQLAQQQMLQQQQLAQQQLAQQQLAQQQLAQQQLMQQSYGQPPILGGPSGVFQAPAAQSFAPYPGQGYDPNQEVLPVPPPAWSQTPQAAPGYVLAANPWGSVPNNLAADGVPENERALEIRSAWGSSVLDTVTVTTQPRVTLGDERQVVGLGPLKFGPFQRIQTCDIEVPSRNLPAKSFVLAESQSQEGTSYVVNVPPGYDGRVERADGTVVPLGQLGVVEQGFRYRLKSAETMYFGADNIQLQVRYVRGQRLIPPPLTSRLNYAWLNTLILVFFIHALAVATFIATPRTQADLYEDIFKNPNRFAQFRLTPEQKQRAANDLLKKLKEGQAGAKAKGSEGKAGRKDFKEKKEGRMAVKGDPNRKDIAKSTLNALFGEKGGVNRSYLFGSGGLGGELKGALGGVTGAEVGDAAGLGGLGTRGSGPGGGGLSMNSVGLGALGTAGHGGGGDGSGYGEGAAGLGKKTDRDISISAGSPIIQGSLDKELIRRVIKQHLAQIRYCYEKELVRSPGLFGKVSTQWTIKGDGTVSDSSVTESTLKNEEVERCIVAKIRTWQFPKPKGGGIVIVKYPFVFKTSG